MASTDPRRSSWCRRFAPVCRWQDARGFRASGRLAKHAHPERVNIERVEATLERLAQHDPLPKEIKLAGSFLYNSELLSFRGLYLNGEALAVDVERGSVGMKNGRLEIPKFELRGRGSAMERIVQFAGQSVGLSSTADEGKLKMRIGGRLARRISSAASYR